MSILQTFILGIIEGITEFLPISSTAHIDFARYFLNIPLTSFLKSYIIIIQLGAILAVFVIYFKKIFSSFSYIRNIIIAFIPTGIIGFILYKIIKSFLIGNTMLAAVMLVVGGVVILYFEKKRKDQVRNDGKEDIKDLSIKELLILGFAQALAVVPGVSRSGAVIIAGRSMNLKPGLIAEFSFLLAIPTMFLASVYDIYKSGLNFERGEIDVLVIGFIVSFVVALIVLRWLINYLKTHSFEIFGWYRVIIGIIIILFLVT